MTLSAILKKNPLVLAPMAGVTDLPFRIICRELGAGLVYSEMVSAEALIRNQRRTEAMLQSSRAERPVVFQLFGSKTGSMAAAARILSTRAVDFIDINMGCPVPKVLRSGSGSALLRNVDLATEIMTAVVAASTLPVTVKIRAGWDESAIVAPELAQAAERAGVCAVAVHARTKAMGFSGRADWTVIKAVKDSVGIPVIGNGDVRSARDAKTMIEQTGCDGVMIGRAVQGNPWIFREALGYLKTGFIPPPATLAEREAVLLRHLRDTVLLLGENTGIREMRKHLCWYTKGLPGGADFRDRVNHLADATSVEREVRDYFCRLAAGHGAEQTTLQLLPLDRTRRL